MGLIENNPPDVGYVSIVVPEGCQWGSDAPLRDISAQLGNIVRTILPLIDGRSFWGVPGGTGGTPHLGLKSHSKCLHLAGWAKPTQLRR
jgi:hypothetical protein